MYRLVASPGVASIETRIAFSGTFVFSTKLIKSVVSLRYDFCVFAVGSRMWSTNDEICSVGPSQPEIIGRPIEVGSRKKRVKSEIGKKVKSEVEKKVKSEVG